MTTTVELRELEKGEGPFYVENVGPTQFHLRESVAKNEINLELGPKGTDQSISVVPKEAFQSQGFRRAVIKGHLNVTTDGSIMDRLSDQIDALAKADEERRAALLGMMDESNATKDLIPGKCVETGCEAPTALTALEQGSGTVPLCPLHEGNQHNYISTQISPTEWKYVKKNTGIDTVIV